MKTFWFVVLALALADAAVVTLVLIKDGGPAGLVWWALLIVPLIIAVLIVVGLIAMVIG